MRMPRPDQATLDQRTRLIDGLSAILPADSVITDDARLRVYECDGLSVYRQLPMVAVLPAEIAEVSAILALCRELGVKVVPRGAGTGLSGGALPLADGLLLAMGKFNRILELDYANRCAVVQPCVANLAITKAVEPDGYFYAPDPSSQLACSIGGNVAENSGGVHCLKYGLTTNNILGVEIVLMDGEIVRLGGRQFDSEGYDLLGVMTGSEGLLGVITEVTVRLLPRPTLAKALLIAFPTIESAGACVAEVIGQGIVPAGMEIMDQFAIRAAEDYAKVGYPTNAEAVMIAELDGPRVEVDTLVARLEAIAETCGAISVRISDDEAEREAFWAGRKAAFSAAGKMSPDYYVMDGTIPRKKLAEVLGRIKQLSEQYGLRVANVFHAGDGNLHPLILYDGNVPGELEKTEAFGAEILTMCVEMGGVLTGEHGVGVEKRDLMPTVFSGADLDQQQRVKCAFDPEGLLNPGKVFPRLRRCAELGQMHVHKGRTSFPDLPRF